MPLPREFGFLIFQYGMHPYLNIAATVLFGVPLIYFWSRCRLQYQPHAAYRLFVISLMLILTIQTVLQILFVNLDESLLMQTGAVVMSMLLLVLYGLVIPSLWGPIRLLKSLQKWSAVLVVFSVLLLVAGRSDLYKGGRFVGIFKHIPHMVTCSTLCFVLTLAFFFQPKKIKKHLFDCFILLCSFTAIVLTGTRSSVAASLVAMGMTLFFYRFKSNQGKLFKFFALLSVFIFAIFFGYESFQYAHDIATGQSALAGRQAQDGVNSRLEEVQRGSEIFKDQPWLGHGLVSKFSSGHEVDVSHYNSMKDPHNIFISAGVVGGWPLMLLALVAVIMCFWGSLKSLMADNFPEKQIAIYVLSHLPILIIYHVHLSIGGMADRVYWLMFSLLALRVTNSVSG